jgi:hypothetical protein
MTDQEINEAIALHLGWLRPEHPDCMKHKIGWSMPEKWWMDPKTVLRFGHDIPNYCTDLNAMAQAVKVLDINDLCRYIDELDKICVPVHICHYTHWIAVVEASARQRAEAFLRTINKWKESK